MRLLKNRFQGYLLFLVILLATMTMGSAITYADSGTATATIKAGGLTESNTANQVNLSVTKQKKVQTVFYNLPLTVTDARGSGSGWNLMITSTTFSLQSTDKDKSKDRLPTNASSIVGVSATCSASSTCTTPTNSVMYPLLVPAGNTPPSPVKFFDATANSGLGAFNITMKVQVAVPAKTEGGTYTSTLTITIASGP